MQFAPYVKIRSSIRSNNSETAGAGPIVGSPGFELSEIQVTSFTGEFAQAAVDDLLPQFAALLQFLAHTTQLLFHPLQHQFAALLSDFKMPADHFVQFLAQRFTLIPARAAELLTFLKRSSLQFLIGNF